MSKLHRLLPALPIHWKLALWSSLLMCALFAGASAMQYVFVEKWMAGREEMAVRRDMRELLNELLAKEAAVEPSRFAQIRALLDKYNTRDGMVRLLDAGGEPVVAASDGLPSEVVYGRGPALPESAATKIAGGVLTISRPIQIFGFDGTVEIVRSLEPIERLMDAYSRIMLLCLAGALLLSVPGGRLLSRLLVRPLKTINETMSKVKQNGLQERMPMDGANDEVAALKRMFNDMMDELQRSFEAQKQFVEDASHELRTPVAVIEGHLALLQRWGKRDAGVLDDSLRISLEELGRLKGLVEELLALSRAERMELDETKSLVCAAPEQVLREIVDKAVRLRGNRDIRLAAEPLAGSMLRIGRAHLEQLLLILLDNAVKYSEAGSRIEIKTAVEDGMAVISVLDYGIGIGAEDLPQVWNRFYRADKARGSAQSGYGLGLSIAKRLILLYGGEIELRSAPGEGTEAIVRLRLAHE